MLQNKTMPLSEKVRIGLTTIMSNKFYMKIYVKGNRFLVPSNKFF